MAYSIILESPSSQHVPFDDDAMGNATLDDAKLAYARAFGEFRDRYYSKGAIIGLPYSYQLRESLERSRCIREAFSFTICRFQVSLFRSFFIKKELGAMFLFLETMCTWGAIILGKCDYGLRVGGGFYTHVLTTTCFSCLEFSVGRIPRCSGGNTLC